MIQETYLFNSIEKMRVAANGIRSSQAYESAKARVLLAWTQSWEKDSFDLFKRAIFELFGDCTVIGSNHFHSRQILSGSTDGTDKKCAISLTFMLFERSQVKLAGIEAGWREEKRQAAELRAFLDSADNVKGLYLVPPDYFCSTEAIMEEAFKEGERVPVFGVKTSLLPQYENFGFNAGEKIMEKRLFVLAFCGEQLKLRLCYNLGWTPVGRVMTVTKAENPFFISEIDNKPATFVYNKYLGLKDEQIVPENLSEFPLIILRNGIGGKGVSRIGVSGPVKGQLVFGAPVYEGDQISLSYGNPDDLFEEIVNDCNSIREFEPQAGLLIVCANRVMLLQGREHEEIDLYKSCLESTAAVYGYAEIYGCDKDMAELNSALISVFFKEEDTGMASHAGGKAKLPSYAEDIKVPFINRLSRFFKEMSAEFLATANEAEAANKAKSAFYSYISHEIRTPLNAVLGMNEMIHKESVEEEIVQYSENIKKYGELLLALINDLLDTEKIEAGKMSIVPVEYSLTDVINELEDMISLSVEKKKLGFNIQADEELPKALVGDEKRIKQCTLNLLSNAVKYTESGEVTLRVSTKPADEGHIWLNISVIDTGKGIRPEDMERLKRPFERVDLSGNYNIEGTGLGLNIVNNLLSLMDSSLDIRSTYGKGSEFSFCVLQGVREAGENTLSEIVSDKTGEDAESKVCAQTRVKSILVVDDTETNIEIIKLFLKERSVDIDEAATGTEAVLKAEKGDYDIILIDNIMPDMNGSETLKRIRSGKKGTADCEDRNTSYILFTADDESEAKAIVEAAGFDGYLTKPVDPKRLNDILFGENHYN